MTVSRYLPSLRLGHPLLRILCTSLLCQRVRPSIFPPRHSRRFRVTAHGSRRLNPSFSLLFSVSKVAGTAVSGDVGASGTPDPPVPAAVDPVPVNLLLVDDPPPVDPESGIPGPRRFPVPFSLSDLGAFLRPGEQVPVEDGMCHNKREFLGFFHSSIRNSVKGSEFVLTNLSSGLFLF